MLVVKSKFDAATRAHMLQSTALLGVSVGNPKFEGKYLAAVIDFINASFNQCLIVVGDTLQRHSLAIEFPNLPQFELYQKARELGDEWIQRNQQILNYLKVPYRVERWDAWINGRKHKENRTFLEKLLGDDNRFRHPCRREEFQFSRDDKIRAVEASMLDSIEGYKNRVAKRLADNQRYMAIERKLNSISFDYLAEEGVVLAAQWPALGYQYVLYPSGMLPVIRELCKYMHHGCSPITWVNYSNFRKIKNVNKTAAGYAYRDCIQCGQNIVPPTHIQSLMESLFCEPVDKRHTKKENREGTALQEFKKQFEDTIQGTQKTINTFLLSLDKGIKQEGIIEDKVDEKIGVIVGMLEQIQTAVHCYSDIVEQEG